VTINPAKQKPLSSQAPDGDWEQVYVLGSMGHQREGKVSWQLVGGGKEMEERKGREGDETLNLQWLAYRSQLKNEFGLRQHARMVQTKSQTKNFVILTCNVNLPFLSSIYSVVGPDPCPCRGAQVVPQLPIAAPTALCLLRPAQLSRRAIFAVTAFEKRM
jgi:hypothetical protein